jgi:hypothetical protein
MTRRTSRRRTSRKIGSGSRFAALVHKLQARGDIADPRALAAAIGRRKFGSKRFQQLAAAGRRRSSLRRNSGFEAQLLARLSKHPKKPYPMQGLVPPGTPIDPKKTFDFVERAISDGRLRDARFALNDYSRWRHHEGHAQPKGGDARATRLSMKVARLSEPVYRNSNSTDPTVVEYAVQYLFKKKSISAAAKMTAKKLSGGTNYFIDGGRTVVSIDPKKLEDAIYERIVDKCLTWLASTAKGHESSVLLGAANHYNQMSSPEWKPGWGPNEKFVKELRKRIIARLGHDPFQVQPNRRRR